MVKRKYFVEYDFTNMVQGLWKSDDELPARIKLAMTKCSKIGDVARCDDGPARPRYLKRVRYKDWITLVKKLI